MSWAGAATLPEAPRRMRRREFLAAIAGATAALRQAHAAERADPVIGYLYAGSLDGIPDSSKKAFWRALAEFGYVRGRNVSIEVRQARHDIGRLPDLARDLVGRGVSVIVVPGSGEAVSAVKAATTTIPIVCVNSAEQM